MSHPLSDRIEGIRARLLRIGAKADPSAESALPSDAVVAEIEVALEELHVAAETLHRQNDTLMTSQRVAETALRESDRRFRHLLETAQEGVWIVDAAANTTLVNPKMVNILGYATEEMIGRSLFEFMEPGSAKRCRCVLERWRHGVSECHEYELQRKDGYIIYALVTAVPLLDGGGGLTGGVALVTDITESKRVEKALLLRTHQLEAVRSVGEEIARELDLTSLLTLIHKRVGQLVGATGGGVWLWDERTQALVCHISARADEREKGTRQALGEGIIGLVAERRQGMIVNDYRHWPQAVPAVLLRNTLTASLAEPLLFHERLVGVICLDNRDMDRSFTEQDGEILRLFAPQAAVAIVNAQLFEEVRASRKRIEALSFRQLEIQENERRALARDLHDEIGQLLTGIRWTLETASASEPEGREARVREAQTVVQELLGRVRSLSLDLRPALLDDMGLLPALLWHFERYTTRTQVHVAFTHDGLSERPCPPAVETAAYRIIQEALTNVARHAHVPLVQVKAWIEAGHLFVRIDDQGDGFDPEEVTEPGVSNGLLGMQERASLLGGRVTVEAIPGTGTEVLVELPLHQGTRQ